MALDDVSAQWLAELGATGAVEQAGQRRLHELLLRAARGEVSRRAGQLRVSGAELDDIAHQAAADAMLAILGKLSSFRGESRFTTWAYKFVMFEVSTKIGRHFWQRPGVAMDAEDWERLPAAFGFGPVEQSQRRELLDALRHAIDQELTERQRRVFVAIVLNGISLDALVVEWETNRNAIYKTLFDARGKLRAALAAKGYLEEGRG
ncbi:sigma-70 family RNA polymerase sigma factor [Actinoplanes sp. NBRC 103695]|uniref:sigma-70 family RNA polymerase sigma factor n=1 Tax=Actinoplanes sp. NBRC 103695 TaxID=3032202 RepID=UPI0024A12E90|nr:sigma-70 family RNA polymerase sigma factor [Actinoplanes sp. NBRC 103695]GLZ00026.1 DNA-directed RNA polymerase sigma-70 factor [Actinoplanes sp. NBRC 103695]